MAAKLTLTDLRDYTTLTAQFNPEKLEGQIKQALTKQPIPGAPQPNTQGTTSEANVFEITLYWDPLASETTNTPGDVLAVLESMTKPAFGRQDILGGESPRVMLLWPGTIEVVARLEAIKFLADRMDWGDGSITRLTTDLSFVEDSPHPLFAEYVRRVGLLRGGS